MNILCRRSLLIGAAFSLGGGAIAAEKKAENPVTAMPTDRFWSIIDQTLPFKSDQQKQSDALLKALVALPAADIEAFDVAYAVETRRGYSWDLWGAGYVIAGGMSDDSFHYFLSWLIAQGRTTFDQAIANPDSLANYIADDAFTVDFEGFAYVAYDAWSKVTGKQPDAFPKLTYPPFPKEPAGQPFDEDEAHLKKRYPKLWARFGETPLG